ncbi:hypothetical protein H9Q09_00940 [Aurantimonas sp. DM33-3]|uniref:hypothetical protein n=1 Tax=Aurantimonas sp. DM33-3 TaxID=2766955 RepID=UPI0016523367|nr:hypothetical protein [Aurantimonas sp. DM33-3]MBC6714750.1 hypothetical protein [Aurantimonas sp. DM33-3]
MTNAIRIGFMAGRGVSVEEIAAQFSTQPGLIRNALRVAGVEVPKSAGGPTIHLIVPIASFIPEIDDVGRRRKMSREEIACEILRVVMAGGAGDIEAIIDRGDRS